MNMKSDMINGNISKILTMTEWTLTIEFYPGMSNIKCYSWNSKPSELEWCYIDLIGTDFHFDDVISFFVDCDQAEFSRLDDEELLTSFEKGKISEIVKRFCKEALNENEIMYVSYE